jgi:hypothetical protein
VPYEERTEAIEHISWPKPNAELIYAIFNAYVEAHPWVSGEDIRPKSVARQMLEGFTSFADYIKDLDLQRSEGVLLRYLTDVYKAMVQNVPPEFHGELWTDLVARLRATLAIVDESLLMEWETLLAGADGKKGPVVLDISADRKLFFARIRAELHALVAALRRAGRAGQLAVLFPLAHAGGGDPGQAGRRRLGSLRLAGRRPRRLGSGAARQGTSGRISPAVPRRALRRGCTRGGVQLGTRAAAAA